MVEGADTSPSFEITHKEKAQRSLVVGMADMGLAGLTAVDYLTDERGMDESGHISAESIPSITPFEKGEPRHHTRIYNDKEEGLSVVLGELFIPVWASKTLSDEIVSWCAKNEVDNITFLIGLQIPHAHEEHDVYYIATKDYKEQMLGNVDIEPLSVGYLEGVHADIISKGIDSSLSVGILATPVHPLAQDVDAALLLLEGFQKVFELEIDTEPLEEYAEEIENYYESLAERMREIESESMSQRDFANDKTYV